MKKKFQEIYLYRELLWNLIVTELKLRYRNSFLGFLWTVLNPLLYLAILAAVFSKIIRFQVDNYVIFLFSGLTSWTMIQQTVVTATASLVNNQALIRKVYIPKIIFPLSNVLARFVDHLILTAVLLVFAVALKAPLSFSLLWLPPIILLHFFFSLGLSLIFSVAYIKVRDTQHLIAIIFQALFFLTPIIYSRDVLPEQFRHLFFYNPFYYFVQLFRFPVYHSQLPSLQLIAMTLGLTFGALATLRQIERSQAVEDEWPLLAEAVRSIVSVQLSLIHI